MALGAPDPSPTCVSLPSHPGPEGGWLVHGQSAGSTPAPASGQRAEGLTVGRFHLKSRRGKGQAGARPQSCL